MPVKILPVHTKYWLFFLDFKTIISLNSNYFEFFTAAAVSLNPKQIKFRQILLLYKAHKNSQYRIVYYPNLDFPFPVNIE